MEYSSKRNRSDDGFRAKSDTVTEYIDRGVSERSSITFHDPAESPAISLISLVQDVPQKFLETSAVYRQKSYVRTGTTHGYVRYSGQQVGGFLRLV